MEELVLINCTQCGGTIDNRSQYIKTLKKMSKFMVNNPGYERNPVQYARFNSLTEELKKCKCQYCGTVFQIERNKDSVIETCTLRPLSNSFIRF